MFSLWASSCLSIALTDRRPSGRPIPCCPRSHPRYGSRLNVQGPPQTNESGARLPHSETHGTPLGMEGPSWTWCPCRNAGAECPGAQAHSTPPPLCPQEHSGGNSEPHRGGLGRMGFSGARVPATASYRPRVTSPGTVFLRGGGLLHLTRTHTETGLIDRSYILSLQRPLLPNWEGDGTSLCDWVHANWAPWA